MNLSISCQKFRRLDYLCPKNSTPNKKKVAKLPLCTPSNSHNYSHIKPTRMCLISLLSKNPK
ncbi:hypothetical protein LguiA_013383 [Lonicera macranthoides]